MSESPRPIPKASKAEAEKILKRNAPLKLHPPTIESLSQVFLLLCAQYQQMGEQLKHLGGVISVLEAEEVERRMDASIKPIKPIKPPKPGKGKTS